MSCGVCAGRNKQGTMCSRCAAVLAERLLLLAGMWPTLAETVQRRDKMPPGQGGETPLPFHQQAATVRANIIRQLTPYVRAARVQHLTDLARYDWRQHDAGPELALTVSSWIDQIRAAVDIPDRAWFGTGRACPEACGGEIRVYAGDRQPVHAQCSKTPEHRWDATQFSRLGKRIAAPGSRLVDVEAAAAHAGVTTATIRQWIATRRLANHNSLISLDELDKARRHRSIRHLAQKWGTTT